MVISTCFYSSNFDWVVSKLYVQKIDGTPMHVNHFPHRTLLSRCRGTGLGLSVVASLQQSPADPTVFREPRAHTGNLCHRKLEPQNHTHQGSASGQESHTQLHISYLASQLCFSPLLAVVCNLPKISGLLAQVFVELSKHRERKTGDFSIAIEH